MNSDIWQPFKAVPCPRGCGEVHERQRMDDHLRAEHPQRRRVEGCPSCALDGPVGPSHDSSPRCESGWHDHCSCGRCFD